MQAKVLFILFTAPLVQSLRPVVTQAVAAASVAVSAQVCLATTNIDQGQTLFIANCAACHAGGGNIVARQRTLSAANLKADGYTTNEKLSTIIANGVGAMPGYGQQCAPKYACTFGARLSDEQISQVANFVQTQAAAGWPSSPEAP